MAKTEMIRARVEPELKHAAEAVLKELGLTPTEAITLFYKQVTLHRGLPFAVELPTAETREAMRDALAGRDLREWPDIETLKAAHR
jgi:DNA-damage-inducible protein J